MEDPRGLLEDFADRPVRDPLSVGETAPAIDGAIRFQPPGNFGKEPRLADSGRAQHGRTRSSPLVERFVRKGEQSLELGLASDQRNFRRCETRRSFALAENFPNEHGLGLSFRGDRVRLAIVEQLPRRSVRLLANEDPVDGRGRFDSRRRVHDVARG